MEALHVPPDVAPLAEAALAVGALEPPGGLALEVQVPAHGVVAREAAAALGTVEVRLVAAPPADRRPSGDRRLPSHSRGRGGILELPDARARSDAAASLVGRAAAEGDEPRQRKIRLGRERVDEAQVREIAEGLVAALADYIEI